MSDYVQVPVREEHVSKVYAFLAQLDREESGNPSPDEEPTPSLDEELVVRMYEDSWSTHRKLLRHLAASPGQWIYTADLAQVLSPAGGSKGMAGLFGAFGRRAKHRYGGAKPWESAWDEGRGENRYRMSPEVAAWIGSIADS